MHLIAVETITLAAAGTHTFDLGTSCFAQQYEMAVIDTVSGTSKAVYAKLDTAAAGNAANTDPLCGDDGHYRFEPRVGAVGLQRYLKVLATANNTRVTVSRWTDER